MTRPSPSVEASVRSLRERIAFVDHLLLEGYAARLRLVEELWLVKRRHGLPLEDPNQEATVLARARAWATAHGLSAVEVERFQRWVIAASKRSAAAVLPPWEDAPPVAVA